MKCHWVMFMYFFGLWKCGVVLLWGKACNIIEITSRNIKIDTLLKGEKSLCVWWMILIILCIRSGINQIKNDEVAHIFYLMLFVVKMLCKDQSILKGILCNDSGRRTKISIFTENTLSHEHLS